MTSTASTVACISLSGLARATQSAARRKFTKDLSWGAVGIQADQREAIELAHQFGFESLSPLPHFLVDLSDGQRDDVLEDLKDKHLAWGAAGLPVDFRKDQQTFREQLQQLPRLAKAMQQAGVTRVSTWIMPKHDELSYLANFRQHAQRLRECVKILGDHGQRFGMEYVGPKTLWASARHPFIHTLAETQDLIAEIGQDNVGVVLDSWHWYTAQETVDDLKTLSNSDIIACDLNDAPAGIPVDEQIDNQRELPAATGVIDLAAFLNTLVDVGYDGPVRAEPFNAALNALDNEPAAAATSAAMDKALALVK